MITCLLFDIILKQLYVCIDFVYVHYVLSSTSPTAAVGEIVNVSTTIIYLFGMQ